MTSPHRDYTGVNCQYRTFRPPTPPEIRTQTLPDARLRAWSTSDTSPRAASANRLLGAWQGEGGVGEWRGGRRRPPSPRPGRPRNRGMDAAGGAREDGRIEKPRRRSGGAGGRWRPRPPTPCPVTTGEAAVSARVFPLPPSPLSHWSPFPSPSGAGTAVRPGMDAAR